jgi:RNA recognition motif. (a.k.a. RRM, RBD, or RNP domain)
VADQKSLNLPEGRWVKFAFFQDCADARFVCRVLDSPHCLILTSSQAFKQHEFFRLVTYRPVVDIRPRRFRTINSPSHNRHPSRIQTQVAISSRWVPDAHALFIGDLPLDVDEAQLREVFSTFGRIVSLSILRRDNEEGEQLPSLFLTHS